MPVQPFRHLAIFLIGLACAGTVVSCGNSSGGGAPPAVATEAPEPEVDAIAVKVQPVRREPLSSIYTTSATLRADKQATVTARTQGVIHQLLVEEGDVIPAGTPLAILENEEQKIEFERATATRDTRRREMERAARLHEQQLMSEEAYEKIRRDAEEARHNAALAELILDRTVIRAPFGGKILVRHLDVGATVSNGDPVYDIADLSPLYADVKVPERQIHRLAPDQSVRVLDGSGDNPIDARIQRIAPRVDASTGTVKVTLAVERSGPLRPGSFVRVEIVTDTHEDALVVPRSALVAEGRRWHLYRVVEGSRVEQLRVERGFEEGDRVEILSVSGERPLSPTDLVVHVGASALSDEAPVEVIDDEDEEGRRVAA